MIEVFIPAKSENEFRDMVFWCHKHMPGKLLGNARTVYQFDLVEYQLGYFSYNIIPTDSFGSFFTYTKDPVDAAEFILRWC